MADSCKLKLTLVSKNKYTRLLDIKTKCNFECSRISDVLDFDMYSFMCVYEVSNGHSFVHIQVLSEHEL